jgi:flagellar hook protein FlgE
VQLSGTNTNFGQGSLDATGTPTDLAVSGNGFFRVKNPGDGSEYATRAGDFRWDVNGYLVTSAGYRVQGKDAAGTIGDVQLSSATNLQSVSVDKTGNVVEFYSDGTSATTNQILLQNYKDPSALTKEGNNLYSGMEAASSTTGTTALLADGSNAPTSNGLGSIQSGSLELSNVDLTQQFSDLITTQRSFEAGSRLITVSDTVLEDIVNLKH